MRVLVLAVGWLTAAIVTADARCTPPTRSETANGLEVRLRIAVQVRAQDGRPAPRITVRFLDTALPSADWSRSRRLGATDEKGAFRSLLVHRWSDYFEPDRRPGAGTFDIIVAEHQVFHYAAECLPIENGERKLTIDVVASSDAIIVADEQEARPRGRRTSGCS